MADISSDIVIVGAGILGLCVALELTARSRDVRVIDPGGANASSVAAGMIAPAFESLPDEVDPARAALFRDAAALWPELAARLGVTLDTRPATWRGAEAAAVAARLGSLGFAVQHIDDRVEAAGDFRIDPAPALEAMVDCLQHPPLPARAIECRAQGQGWRVITSDGPVLARHIVIATGTAAALPGLPAGVASLIEAIEPIAGQIGRSAQVMVPGGVWRGADGYVAAAPDHLVIGATMVAGSRDSSPDPVRARRLEAVAESLLGQTLDRAVVWRGGIRGATADGLPLAGSAGWPGLHLALAPRRNGWLLGPLVGQIVADGIDNARLGPHAVVMAPLRSMPG